MTDQFALFGRSPVEAADSNLATFVRPDVVRVIEQKTGPFFEVRDGIKTGREYQLVQLADGQIVREFTDNGERCPATQATTRILIDDMVRGGVWKVVA